MLTASHNLPKLERATPASKFKTEIQTLERSLCESFDQYKLPIKILPYIQRYNDRLKSGASTLFDSLEMINTEFADLHNSLFQQPMWGDFAIGDPIFQGLQLILFWYHLVAIEAYVSDALYKQDKKS